MEERELNGIGFIAGSWPPDPAKPSLVFIHGASFSNVFWKNQIEGLKGHANTNALDLPGHGKSTGDGKSKIADYAREVLNFIDSIGIPQPVLCGHSMGGAIVQQLLISHTDRFRAGILTNTGAKLKVMPAIFEAIKKDYRTYIDLFSGFAVSKKSNPIQIREVIETLAKCRPEVALADFRACNDFDLMEQLHLIEAPVLIIAGNNDNVTPLKYGTHLHKSIKNSRLVQMKQAGHIAPMENPDEVNKAICEFLEHIG